jgi:integrase
MAARKTDPIKKIEFFDDEGKVRQTRYRIVVDFGKKPDGRRDQRTFTFDTYKEAKTERARIITERSKGTLVQSTKITVEEYLTDWLATKSGKKPSTQRSYADALRPVLALYPRMRLRDLDVPNVEALKSKMLSGELRKVGTPGEPLSPRSVNLTLTVLTMALNAAIKRQRPLVAVNVAELVDRVPADTTAGEDRAAWQTEDAVAFLRHVMGDRLYAAWLLSLLGLRRGEVVGLRWEDIDLEGLAGPQWRFPSGTPSLGIVPGGNRVLVAGVVHVGDPKSRKSGRRLPLFPMVTSALKGHRKAQAAERLAAGSAWDGSEGLVFVDEIGRPLNPERYSDWWLTHGKAAQLPRLTLHGARHCAASLMAEMDVPDVVRAAWLGHASITITAGYTHAQARQLIEAGQTFERVLTG